MGSTPTSVTSKNDPVVQRQRRLDDSQENGGSIPPGAIVLNRPPTTNGCRGMSYVGMGRATLVSLLAVLTVVAVFFATIAALTIRREVA